MVDYNGEYSDLVEDAPIDTESNFFDKIYLNGELTKLDNIAGGGEVVRTVPKLVRSIP